MADARAEIVKILTQDHYVPDWPADEIEYFRNGDWTSFSERAEKLASMRAEKIIQLVVPEVDELAQFIRKVDGNHDLGAGRLAELIVSFIEEKNNA